DVLDRIAVYELLQHLHRILLHVDIVFWHTAQRFAADAIDLPRLNASVLRAPDGSEAGPLRDAGLEHRGMWIGREQIPARPEKGKNVLVVPRESLSDAAVHRIVREGRCDHLICAGCEDEPPPELAAMLAEFKPEKERGRPLCYWFQREVKSPIP